MSPTSSRKIVPPSASTNLPVCLRSAPVNEPRSWPKSSDSMRLSGIAAQFTCTNGPAFTSEPSWIARATSSLPVPLGPTMRTVAGVGAAFATSASSRRIASLFPTRRVMPRRDFSSRFSRARRVESRTRRSAFRTCSDESGFSRKSSAPACTASIAVFTSPWPEMTITGVAIPRARSFASVSSPSWPGILMSRSTASWSGASETAFAPEATAVTSYPSSESSVRSDSRMSGSSSQTRMRRAIPAILAARCKGSARVGESGGGFGHPAREVLLGSGERAILRRRKWRREGARAAGEARLRPAFGRAILSREASRPRAMRREASRTVRARS